KASATSAAAARTVIWRRVRSNAIRSGASTSAGIFARNTSSDPTRSTPDVRELHITTNLQNNGTRRTERSTASAVGRSAGGAQGPGGWADGAGQRAGGGTEQ